MDVKGDIPGLNVTTRHGFALKLCANVIRDHCDVDFHTIYCVRGFFTFTILFTFRTRGCSVVETLLDNCSNKYSSQKNNRQKRKTGKGPSLGAS